MIKSIEKSRDKAAKGAVYLTLSVLTVKIIGFVYKLPISYLIGDEGMGYFNTAYTVFSFFYLICTGGVPKAVSLLVAEESGRGSEAQGIKILFYAVRLFSAIGAILTLGLLIFANSIASLIGNSLAGFSLVCIAPSLLFVASGGVLRGYLNGKMKLSAVAVSSLVEGVFKFILGLSFAILGVRLGFSVPIISGLTILGISISSFISTLILYLYCRKSLANRTKEKKTNECADILRSLLKIALPITLSTAISGLSSMIDLSLIMRRLLALGLSELEAGALYGNYTTLALPLLSFATSLLVPICTACAPLIASDFAKRDFDSVRENAEKFFKATAFFAIPASLGFLFFGEEILMLLFEDSSAKIATPMLFALSPSVVFLSVLTLVNTFLEAIGRAKSALLSMAIGCGVKVILSYVLLGNERISILGAPISTTVSYAVSMLISVLIFYKSTGCLITAQRSLFKIGLVSLVSVSSARALYLAICKSECSWLSFLICLILCVVIYLFLSMFFGIFELKRDGIMSNITKNSRNNWQKRRN